MLLKLFVVVCLFQIEKIVCTECPSPSDILPCSCVAYQTGLKVNCPDTKNENLYSALDVFSRNRIYVNRMYISSTTLNEIDDNFFGNATIGEVTFYTPKVFKVDHEAFEGQENSLYDIFFSNSVLTEIPARSINILARLKEFRYLFTAETKAIRGSLFTNQVNKKSVDTLIFSFNGIESIEPGAFTPLTNLKFVSFYENPLKIIDPSSFPPATNRITYLGIQNSSLEAIPRKVLESLPLYAMVSLKNNKIKTLEKEDITVIINKEIEINLTGNELNCDCDFLVFANTTMKRWPGICATPKQRLHISLNSLKFTDFPDCPR